MPHNPDPAPLDLPAPPNGDHFGRLYGSEYEFNYKNIRQNEDVPCAVCHDIYATSSLMIPGKTVCPGHWTKQFDGFLTSAAIATTLGPSICASIKIPSTQQRDRSKMTTMDAYFTPWRQFVVPSRAPLTTTENTYPV